MADDNALRWAPREICFSFVLWLLNIELNNLKCLYIVFSNHLDEQE